MIESGSKVGHYLVEEHVGEGGMGTVYRARDTRLERTVALKFIRRDFSQEPDFERRFLREAKTAAKIDSEHVVRIWEWLDSDHGPVIVSEYIGGERLRDTIQHADEKTGLELALQTAHGIAAAHALNVVHGDIKPENIKITSGGLIKILDFGLARTLTVDTVDVHGEIQGTLAYMAPEQLSGTEATLKSDLFSFGVVLYELFAKKRPFDGDYPAATVYRILHEQPEPPSVVRPGIPSWLESIILRLLEKDPDERPESIEEVVALLQGSDSERDERVTPVRRRRQTVTVLDIANLSGETTWDYFCLGFSEDLTREISRRTKLIVSPEPETSVRRDIRELFRSYRTDYIVTGSLMKWEHMLRLDLSIYGEDGDELVFGRKFEGSSDSVFSLLTTASEAVADALAEATDSDAVAVEDQATGDVTAYDFYLRGRNYYQTNTERDLNFAAEMFSRALEIDPDLALGHAGLSDVYAFQYMAYYDRSPQRIADARAEAEKALELNPKLPEAHRALGRYFMFTGDIETAEQAFKKAIEIAPNWHVGYRTLAWLEDLKCHYNRALNWAKKSLHVAPTDLETLLLISLLYLRLKKYTLALATLQRTLELAPDYGRAHYHLGMAYSKLGVFDLAVESLKQAAEYGGDPNSLNDAGYMYLIMNELDAADDMFRRSLDAGHLPFVSSYYMGLTEVLRGKLDQSRQLFAESLAQCETYLEQDPGNAHLNGYKAMALAALGLQKDAGELATAIEKTSPLQGDIMFTLACAHATLRQEEEALRLCSLALDGKDGPSLKEAEADPHIKIFLGGRLPASHRSRSTGS